VKGLRALLAACVLAGCAAHAQTARPGDAELNRAYQALASKDYDEAIALFRRGLAKQPQNAAAHKDLAYTLLKAGENEDARDEFEAAMHADPKDDTAALEYAFLAFETKKQVEAREIFDRLRKSQNPATRATAEQAFENIDRPLAEGIARWEQALARAKDPNDISTFSAHWELAQLAELRDDLPLAAEQYGICHKLKPQLPELLLILARVWRRMGRAEDSRAALLAASRSEDSRTAELASEQMDPRYPYPYEFRAALALDPGNVALRRELAFLYLAMQQKQEAIAQFKQVLLIDPGDKLSRSQLRMLEGNPPEADKGGDTATAGPSSGASAASDPKAMGKKSLALGYTRDAIKYLSEAHEQDPNDADTMLQLGWAYNAAKDDTEASYWFDQARHAADPVIAAQALRAYRNLNPESFPQTTIWMLPMYSSRWNDAFVYGQLKRTIPLPWTRVNRNFLFYVSDRFDGDFRGTIRTAYGPGSLSEGAHILAAGVSSRTWHRAMLWAEAGEAIVYMPRLLGRSTPEYRGGLHYDWGKGRLLGSSHAGFFYETSEDTEYVSEFDHDWMAYSQHRVGRTLSQRGRSSMQMLWNVNYTRDTKDQYWANTIETGPGVKLHLPWMPQGMYAALDLLRGMYTRGPYIDSSFRAHASYNDVRLSFWFARTR
jgi:tetratricopeptide (TPR) repeat protein